MSVSQRKDTEEAAIAKEQALWIAHLKQLESLYQTFLSQGIAEQQPEVRSIKPSVKIYWVLVEENMGGLELKYQLWHARI